MGKVVFALMLGLALVLPLPAAFAYVDGPPLTMTETAVNAGVGAQTDPHVSGSRIVYTSDLGGTIQIGVYDLASGQSSAISNGPGEFDHLPDVQGTRVVFTRVTATSDIYLHDLSLGTSVELDPQPNSDRRGVAIGGSTVAWQELDIGQSLDQTEIAVHDLTSGTTTVITDDDALDGPASMAPDGSALVWTKCSGGNADCDVYAATRAGVGWDVRPLTSGIDTAGGDTDGTLAVYASFFASSGDDNDIYWQPIGGGTESRLVLPGFDRNPNIVGNLISFEHRDPGAFAFDLMVYDLDTDTLYRVTNSPASEFLNDISRDTNGTIHVAYTVDGNDFDVYALSFRLPEACPETSCSAPGDRPLHAQLTVRNSFLEALLPIIHGSASRKFDAAAGDGLLCLANGEGGSPAMVGSVKLNGATIVGSSEIDGHVALVEKPVTLKNRNELVAKVSGRPGAAYTVRVYGPPSCEP